MPQMMPLNWVAMFMTIILLLTLFTTIMFNTITPTTKKGTSHTMTSHTKKWSW